MNVSAIIVAPLALSGCALMPNVANYPGPAAVEITDRAAYKADLATCIAEVKLLPEHFDLQHLGAGAVSGAANGLPGVTLNPLVPVLTAAGGMASAGFDDLNVLGIQAKSRVNKCMTAHGLKSGAYVIVD